MGMDQDDLILAPYTTVQKRILAITHLQSITCSALSEEYTDQAIEEITQILRTNHKLKATDEDDFTIRSQQELSSMLTSTTDMMTLLLAAVAGISLLVGGIGIMNIMYVSVTERTREIGLRMSIGAKGRDILAQFLIESILISVTGGVIGILVGVGAAVLVNIFAAFPIYIQPWSVFLSFAVCTLTGISGPESRDAQPHRRTALRITALGDKVPTLFFGKPAESETAVARQKKKHEIPG